MDAEKLARTFVDVADSLVDDFDVLDLLHVLTTRCAELFGAAAVGLMLADGDGHLRVTVASREDARLLDVFQIQSDEGPCLECYRSGGPVIERDLQAAATRWPRFAVEATKLGFASVVALPLRLRGKVIGALNLFGESENTSIDPNEIPLAQALADVATIAILQERLARDRTLLNEQLQHALNSRIAIEQAKGALSNRFDIGPEEAFELLRDRARSTRQRLTKVAEQIMLDGLSSW
jgi:GAF domain-containing protein